LKGECYINEIVKIQSPNQYNEGIKIVKMTFENINDYDNKNQNFQVVGRLVPTYKNNCWSYQEEIYEKPFESKYQEESGLEDYIVDKNSIAFLYYVGEVCVGQITLSKSSTKYVSIDRLIISENHRGKREADTLCFRITFNGNDSICCHLCRLLCIDR